MSWHLDLEELHSYVRGHILDTSGKVALALKTDVFIHWCLNWMSSWRFIVASQGHSDRTVDGCIYCQVLQLQSLPVYIHTHQRMKIYIFLKINNIPFALDQGAYRCPRSISFTPDALEKNRMLKWIWRFTVRWLNWYCAARAQPIWMSRTCSAEGSVPVSLTALPLSICFTDRKVSEDIRILRTRLHLQYRVSDTASEQRGAKPETQKYSSFLIQGKQTTKNKCL